jgi:hypothetical protein
MKFELPKNHKIQTIYNWKTRRGLIAGEHETQIIYTRYVNAEFCEICNKEFLTLTDRQMDHDHKSGKFRNVCCQSCNLKKSDIKLRKHNTSGYKNIYKKPAETNQGFTWVFIVHIDGKNKQIKSSVNLEKLVEFAENWKKENNYNT